MFKRAGYSLPIRGLEFTDTDGQEINLGNPAFKFDTTKAWTAGIWFKYDTITNDESLITKWGASGPTRQFTLQVDDSPTANQLALYANATLRIRLTQALTPGQWYVVFVTSPNHPTSGTWTLYCFNVDGSVFEVGTSGNTGNASTLTEPIRLGNRSAASDNFDGELAHAFCLKDKVNLASAQQIVLDPPKAIGAWVKKHGAYWHLPLVGFTQGTELDLSGSGNHGTVNGSPLPGSTLPPQARFGRYVERRFVLEEAAAAGGAITGSANITFSDSATMRATGSVVGSAAITFSDAAVLRGTGSVIGSASITFSDSAVIQGIGNLVGSAAITLSDAAVMRATGVIVGSAAITFSDATVLRADAFATGSAAITFSDSVAIKGLGALVGSAAITFSDPGTTIEDAATGVDPITGSASITFSSSTVIRATGVVVGSVAITFSSVVAMRGTGSIVGSASITFNDAAVIKGVGNLAGAASITFSDTATIKGIGNLIAAVSILFSDNTFLRADAKMLGSAAITFSSLVTLGKVGADPITGSASISFSSNVVLRANYLTWQPDGAGGGSWTEPAPVAGSWTPEAGVGGSWTEEA